MTEIDKKVPEGTVQNPEAKSRPLQYSGVDCSLSVKISLGYTERSMALDDVSRSWIPSYRLPACLRNLETDERYEHINPILGALFSWNGQRENVSLSKILALFQRIRVVVYGTAAVVHEDYLLIDLAHVSDKALQLNIEQLALLFLVSAVPIWWNYGTGF